MVEISMKKVLLFFITEDWFFLSHFLDRATAALEDGYEVHVCCNDNGELLSLRELGFTIHRIDIDRSSLNVLKDAFLFLQICRILKDTKPYILHNIALKPIFYGTLAAFIFGIKNIVNAPVGLGFVFTSTSFKAKFLRPIIIILFKFLLNPKNAIVIFENTDDLSDFVNFNYVRQGSARLIKGAGVDLKIFNPPLLRDNKIPQIVLIARMLVDKGIHEFIKAAFIINKNDTLANFVLVGDVDKLNPSSLSSSYLSSIIGSFGIKWLGYQSNISQILSNSDIACLPSYREGLPKFLIEAAAAGLPIVTTDVPGCREVVVDGLNGFLVPPCSEVPLASALLNLIYDPSLRLCMGLNSRKLAEKQFSRELVCFETLSVYKEFNKR